MFCAQSNQTMLNYYNLLVSLVQRTNTDISPCTNLQAVVEYLSKYYTKAEVALFLFKATLKALVPIVSLTNQPVIQLVAKAINKIVGSRNQGTQEVCYLLLGLYLQKGTRVVLLVDCRILVKQGRTLALNNNKEAPPQEDVRKGKSHQTKYLERPIYFEETSYFTVLTECDLSGPRLRALSRGALRLLSYFPKYKNNPTDSIYEDYCRIQIILQELVCIYPILPVTLRDNQDAPYVFARYSDAYRQYRANYYYSDPYLAPLQRPSAKVQARIDAEDF